MKGKKGPLVVLDYPGGQGGGMTAARYQEQVLEKVVHNFYQEASEERGWVLFEQENKLKSTPRNDQRCGCASLFFGE
jgi:hypothetical protein